MITGLEWNMIIAGMVCAFFILLLDLFTGWRWGIRIPVLSTALGLYLPFELSVPIFLVSTFISYIVFISYLDECNDRYTFNYLPVGRGSLLVQFLYVIKSRYLRENAQNERE